MAGEDPHLADVSLLLPMTGASGSTHFVDYSPSPKIITAAGNAQISAAQSKWGGGSGYFDGVNDYLQITSDASLEFGTGDFTIELWIYFNYIDFLDEFPRLLHKSHGGFTGWFLAGHKDHPDLYFGTLGSLPSITLTMSSVPQSTWTHIAVTRSGSTIGAFVDGVAADADTCAYDINSTEILYVGTADYVSSRDFKGYLQDIRITKGVARYTSNFTPPGRLVTCAYPDYSPGAAPLAGTAKKANGDPAEHVLIRAWDNRAHIIEVTPAANGAWSADVPAGSYDVTYLADGCAPICHGPYTVAEP